MRAAIERQAEALPWMVLVLDSVSHSMRRRGEEEPAPEIVALVRKVLRDAPYPEGVLRGAASALWPEGEVPAPIEALFDRVLSRPYVEAAE